MDEKEKKELEASMKDVDETPEPTAHDVDTKDIPAAASETDDHMLDVAGPSETATSPTAHSQPSFIDRLKAWTLSHKWQSALIAAGVLLVLGGGVVVATDLRFAVMNLFGKSTVEVVVTDGKSSQPIPQASVSLAGVNVQSDDKGKATLKNVAFGRATLKVTKSAYSDSTQSVLVSSGKSKLTATLHPVGAKVVLSVTNTISGKPIGLAKATVGQSDAVADGTGTINLVVPPQDQKLIKVTLSADGYNTKSFDIALDGKQAKVTLTPAGKIYFLSKRTGTINVMKANLDGTDSKVVVTGTGKESETGTVLLASRDWKYLALLSRREGENEKVYLVDTADESLKVVDEGKANFRVIGWSGHSLVYTVYRPDVEYGQPKQSSIKAYNADSSKIVTIDDTRADMGNPQQFGDVYIVKDGMVFARNWSGAGKFTDLVYANNSGTLKVVKEFPSDQHPLINLRVAAPDRIYGVTSPNYPLKSIVFEYEAGKVVDSDETSDEIYGAIYPTKLLSANDSKTLWSEPRDGKITVIIGDEKGENGKEVLRLDDYSAYGWFSNEYVLLSKGGSELYVLPADAGTTQKPLKLTDYHKPTVDFRGYGYGYGGL